MRITTEGPTMPKQVLMKTAPEIQIDSSRRQRGAIGRNRVRWVGVLLAVSLWIAQTAAAIEIEEPPIDASFSATRGAASAHRVRMGSLPSPHFAVFDVELPMAFRARLAGLYTYTPFLVDAMAYDRQTRLGPAVRSNHFFETRLAIARPVRRGLELEVAWSSQSLVSMTANPVFDRQTVGAFIRFTH